MRRTTLCLLRLAASSRLANSECTSLIARCCEFCFAEVSFLLGGEPGGAALLAACYVVMCNSSPDLCRKDKIVSELLRADYSPASRARTILVPGQWIRDSLLQPRDDGQDTLTLTVTKRFVGERWKWITLRGGALLPIAASISDLRPLPRLVPDDRFEVTVYAPPSLIGVLRLEAIRLRPIVGPTGQPGQGS